MSAAEQGWAELAAGDRAARLERQLAFWKVKADGLERALKLRDAEIADLKRRLRGG